MFKDVMNITQLKKAKWYNFFLVNKKNYDILKKIIKRYDNKKFYDYDGDNAYDVMLDSVITASSLSNILSEDSSVRNTLDLKIYYNDGEYDKYGCNSDIIRCELTSTVSKTTLITKVVINTKEKTIDIEEKCYEIKLFRVTHITKNDIIGNNMTNELKSNFISSLKTFNLYITVATRDLYKQLAFKGAQ